MSIFRRRQGGNQGVSRDGTVLKKPEIVWDENSTLKQNQYLKTLLPIIDFFNQKTNDYAKEEIVFAKFIQKRGKDFEVSNSPGDNLKPKSAMTEEEVKKMELLKSAYEEFGSTLVRLSVKRKNLSSGVDKILNKEIGELLKEEETLDKTLATYETSLEVYNQWRKKVDKLNKQLSSAEQKTIATKTLKKKEKKQKEEEKKLSSLKKVEDEFELVKKMTVFLEQKAQDECDYQKHVGEDRFVHKIGDVVKEYINFHKTALESFQELEKNLKLDTLTPPAVERKKKTELEDTREVFKFGASVGLIGISIDEVMKRPKETGPLPKLILDMFTICERHLEKEGIFRKAGNKERISYLMRYVDTGKIDNLDEYKNEPYVVSSALKEYVRDLPDDFAPWNLFSDFFTQTNKKKQRAFIQDALKKLSPATQQMFYYIFDLCKKVEKHQKKNKMGSENLARVWSVNMFRDELLGTKDPMKLRDMAALTDDLKKLFIFMLDDFSNIYAKSPAIPKYTKEKRKTVTEKEYKSIKQKYLKARIARRNQGMDDADDGADFDEETPGGTGDGGGDLYAVSKNYYDYPEVITCMDKVILQVEPEDGKEASEKTFVVVGDEKGFVKTFKVDEKGITNSSTLSMCHTPNSPITALLVLRDGKRIVSAAKDRSIKVWNLEKAGQHITLIDDKFGEDIELLVETTKNNLLVVASGNKMSAFDLTTFQKKLDYQTKHTKKISQLFCHKKTSAVYSVSKEEGIMYQWTTDRVELKGTFMLNGEKICHAVACEDKKVKVITCMETGKYVKWVNQKRKNVIDTYKELKIENAVLLNGSKDQFLMVFDNKPQGPKPSKSIIAVVISSVGIVNEYKISDKLVNLKKIDDSSYAYFDDANNICIHDVKKKLSEFKHQGDILDIMVLNGRVFSVSKTGRIIMWTGDKELDENIPPEELKLEEKEDIPTSNIINLMNAPLVKKTTPPNKGQRQPINMGKKLNVNTKKNQPRTIGMGGSTTPKRTIGMGGSTTPKRTIGMGGTTPKRTIGMDNNSGTPKRVIEMGNRPVRTGRGMPVKREMPMRPIRRGSPVRGRGIPIRRGRGTPIRGRGSPIRGRLLNPKRTLSMGDAGKLQTQKKETKRKIMM